MRKPILALALALTLSLGLAVNASAANYVADDITYQNLNGQQLAIKVYTLLPEQDPADLVEDDFEYDGYLYSYSSTTKEEQTFDEENLHTETVTVTTAHPEMGSVTVNTSLLDLSSGSWSGQYFTDYPITVTAAANDGYKFVGWKGDTDGAGETVTVSVDGGITLEAVFAKVQ